MLNGHKSLEVLLFTANISLHSGNYLVLEDFSSPFFGHLHANLHFDRATCRRMRKSAKETEE